MLYKRPKSPVNVLSKGSQGQQNPFSDVLVTCSLTTNPISHHDTLSIPQMGDH